MLNERSIKHMDPQTNKRDRLLLLFRQKARLMEALHSFRSSLQENTLKIQKKKTGAMTVRKAYGIRYGVGLNDPSVEIVQAKNPNPL